jgi:hypothetical protein
MLFRKLFGCSTGIDFVRPLINQAAGKRAILQQINSGSSKGSAKFSTSGPSDVKHVWSKEWDRLSFGATPPWKHDDREMKSVRTAKLFCTCLQEVFVA